MTSATVCEQVQWFEDVDARIAWSKRLQSFRNPFSSRSTDAWASELFQHEGDGRVYAHALFRGETEWVGGLLDIGIASLHGAPMIGIPPASEYGKAVLDRYITAPANCFESMETVLSRVKADRGDTTHVVEILRKRATVVDARWRTATFSFKKRILGVAISKGGAELYLSVVLRDPKKMTQILLKEVPLADGAASYLELVPEGEEWPTKADRDEELVQVKELDKNKTPEEHKRNVAYRRFFGSTDSTAQKQALVETVTDSKTMFLASLDSRKKDEFRTLANHIKRSHAPNIDADVVLFLLVAMVEGRTPFLGWFTRKSQELMRRFRINEAKFEASLGGVLAVKTVGFFADGLVEAASDGFGLSSLVAGFSYAFTWFAVTPSGSLHTLFGTFGQNLPVATSLLPFVGALFSSYSMMQHAKHAFDSAQEIKKSAQAATVGKEASTERFANVLVAAKDQMITPGYRDYNFDYSPLGSPGGSTPLVQHTLTDKSWEGVLLYFSQDNERSGTLTVHRGDDVEQHYLVFKQPTDVSRASRAWKTPKRAERLAIRQGIITGPGLIAPLDLCLPMGPLTETTRRRLVASFVESCDCVSGVGPSSRLGVALRVALFAVLERASELIACEKTDATTVLHCLLRGEDTLPLFRATLSGGALSDVERVFCS